VQVPPASEAVKAMAGMWELSNPGRDRICTVVLRATAAGHGYGLQWGPSCGEAFAFTATAVAWRVGTRDALQFLDAGGVVLAELTEVEGGLYEGERRGQGLMFLQSLASRAAEEKTAAQLAGEWAFTASTGRVLCRIALADAPAAAERLALSVRPGCDAAIARFGPAGWQIDRGQLVLVSRRGETWRFEELDALTWRRIPAGPQALTLVRQ
jgi:hypothetical protein